MTSVFSGLLRILERIYFKIVVTIPVTSFSCERCFSKFSFVKIKLRIILNQVRLDDLLNQELARNINFEDVIECFKILKLFKTM